MDAGTFKGCLRWGNCLKWFKRKKMIDVSAVSPWVEPAQGLIRPATQPPHPHPLLLHTAVGFCLTIQGWIDEPLFVFQPCTFLNLKSQFILGKRKRKRRMRRRRELKKNFRTFLFFLLCCSLPAFKCHSAPPPYLHWLHHLEGGIDVPRLQKDTYSFIGGKES